MSSYGASIDALAGWCDYGGMSTMKPGGSQIKDDWPAASY
jgi:hypothetical protein